MTIPSWVNEYIGIPFKRHGRDRDGCDCWGLLRLVLADQFETHIPSFAGHTWVECGGRAEREVQRAELEALMEANKAPWRPVVAGQERAGTGIRLRQEGRAMHVGIVVTPGWMLHIEHGTNAALEEYTSLLWRRRVVGFYEWAGA